MGWSVIQTLDGGYVIAGYTYSFGNGNSDVYLIRTDSLGDTLWTKLYGGDNSDAAFDLEITSDGGYIIVGSTDSYGFGGEDVYLIKTEPDVDIEEESDIPKKHNYGSTVTSGPFLLPEDKMCRIFDIAGRNVTPDKMIPGIYFIEIDGVIIRKVVKIR